MKITVTLTEAEVKGLKKYLKETSGDINPKITKRDIEIEIMNIVSNNLSHGAIGDYVQQYDNL